MALVVKDNDILDLLPRHPERRSAPQILERLKAAGYDIAPRTLERRLISCLTADLESIWVAAGNWQEPHTDLTHMNTPEHSLRSNPTIIEVAPFI